MDVERPTGSHSKSFDWEMVDIDVGQRRRSGKGVGRGSGVNNNGGRSWFALG